MKMYCKIKRPDNAKEKIEKGEKIIIQEKIDGSNTAIYNDNGTIRYFSRSNELTGEDGLSGFVKYAKICYYVTKTHDEFCKKFIDVVHKTLYNVKRYVNYFNFYILRSF